MADVHENGAKRHGGDWISANQAAVNALGGTSLTPWDPKVKEAIPRVVLYVLDRLKHDAGFIWDRPHERWIPPLSPLQSDVLRDSAKGDC